MIYIAKMIGVDTVLDWADIIFNGADPHLQIGSVDNFEFRYEKISINLISVNCSQLSTIILERIHFLSEISASGFPEALLPLVVVARTKNS